MNCFLKIEFKNTQPSFDRKNKNDFSFFFFFKEEEDLPSTIYLTRAGQQDTKRKNSTNLLMKTEKEESMIEEKT